MRPDYSAIEDIESQLKSLHGIVCASSVTFKMLLFLVTMIALRINSASTDFLDDCPIDLEQRIDDDRVVDILETFYKDLQFVQASTQSRQVRDYSRLSQGLEECIDSHRQMPWTEGMQDFFILIVELLGENRLRHAALVMHHNIMRANEFMGWPSTYFEYFQAELSRLVGNNSDASLHILNAYLERQYYRGIAVDDISRQDGLIALQKVSHFNRNVDEMYGLRQSPDYQLLPLLHLMLKDELKPLAAIRSAVWGRLFETAPPIAAAEATTSVSDRRNETSTRMAPAMDDFSGQSLAKASVEGILCEFARKLSILGVSSQEGTSSMDVYNGLIDQLRQLDPLFAEELSWKVMSHIQEHSERAFENANALRWIMMNSPLYDATRDTFMSYFTIELGRQSRKNCTTSTLVNSLTDLDSMKNIRRTGGGISLAKLIELEAKVAFLWLRCFHERVKWAYQLDGTEDGQQLDAKRAQFGTGQAIIPRP